MNQSEINILVNLSFWPFVTLIDLHAKIYKKSLRFESNFEI